MLEITESPFGVDFEMCAGYVYKKKKLAYRVLQDGNKFSPIEVRRAFNICAMIGCFSFLHRSPSFFFSGSSERFRHDRWEGRVHRGFRGPALGDDGKEEEEVLRGGGRVPRIQLRDAQAPRDLRPGQDVLALDHGEH